MWNLQISRLATKSKHCYVFCLLSVVFILLPTSKRANSFFFTSSWFFQSFCTLALDTDPDTPAGRWSGQVRQKCKTMQCCGSRPIQTILLRIRLRKFRIRILLEFDLISKNFWFLRSAELLFESLCLSVCISVTFVSKTLYFTTFTSYYTIYRAYYYTRPYHKM